VHVVGFTIEIYYDAQPCEHQSSLEFIIMCVVSSAFVQDEVWDLPSCYVVVMQKWFRPSADHQTLQIGLHVVVPLVFLMSL
jgi:hypothetical protein